jgi:hypothetical protein
VSSLATRRQGIAADEAVLYVATAVALSSAILAAGWASGSARVGFVGAGLVSLGVWVSWHTRSWPRSRRLLMGALIGLLSAGSLQALISWEMATEVGRLYVAPADIGLHLALRMSVALVGFSFLLFVREMLPFSLVPGLALFGLAGGRGTEAVAFGCFLLFLPSGLISVGQAMMLSGVTANWRSAESPRAIARWRYRHWLTISLLIATILLVGLAIHFPAYAYGTRYYWHLGMMDFGGSGVGDIVRDRRSTELARSYSVGRGPIAPAERPVFSFEGTPSGLWRGEVYDQYLGTSWRSSDDSPRPLPVRDGILAVQEFLRAPSEESLLTHTVRAEADLEMILYSPGQIQQAILPAAVFRSLPEGVYVDKFGCVFAPGSALSAGARYQIVSHSLGGAPMSSRQAGAQTPRAPDELDESYLRIPLGARRAADLARSVAANASTPTDKLAALVTYLQQNCAYTLNPPAVPLGEDAVEHFLFQSRRGYCDLFATALAIMGRGVGIPTRFVTGYAGGRYDPESGRYVLRESDAHAWVEAYVSPYGWVSIDPAPAGDVPPVPPLQKAFLSLRFLSQDRPALTVAFVVTCGAVLVLVALLLRRARAGRRLLSPEGNDPATIVRRAYARLSHILGKTGRPRPPTQTPLEYLRALESGSARTSGRVRPLPLASLTPIRSLTDMFVVARYGHRPVEAEAARVALQRLEEARLALRKPS